MGQLLNSSSNLFNEIIDTKQDLNYSDYSKHLETKPIIVTYYNQNLAESTADAGLQAVEKYVGDNSPIKYNKIKGLPLYSVPLTNLDLDFDEKGPHFDFEADGVIPPGIIEPKPHDFLEIDYLGKKFLFKVTDVHFDTIRSNHYYKITFHFSKNNNGDIYKNVTENSTVVYDDIGSNTNKCLLLDDDYKECENLLQLSKDMISFVKRKFWNDKLGYFIFNKNIYDPWLNYFLKEEKVLQLNSFDNEIYIQDPLTVDSDNFYYYYDTSYFKYLIEKNKDDLINNHVILVATSNRIGSIFYMNRKSNTDMIFEVKRIYLNEDEIEALKNDNNIFLDYSSNNFKLSSYLDGDIITRIIENNKFDDPNPIEDIINILISYFNSEDIPMSDKLSDKFNKYKKMHDITPTFTTFIILFSYMYIVKESISSIRKK